MQHITYISCIQFLKLQRIFLFTLVFVNITLFFNRNKLVFRNQKISSTKRPTKDNCAIFPLKHSAHVHIAEKAQRPLYQTEADM